MTILSAPKIDCHLHAIDPARFPYAPDTPYRPSGQEVAPAAHLLRVLDVFNVRHALLVGTNSGYGADSRCQPYRYRDTWPFISALAEAFTHTPARLLGFVAPAGAA